MQYSFSSDDESEELDRIRVKLAKKPRRPTHQDFDNSSISDDQECYTNESRDGGDDSSVLRNENGTAVLVDTTNKDDDLSNNMKYCVPSTKYQSLKKAIDVDVVSITKFVAAESSACSTVVAAASNATTTSPVPPKTSAVAAFEEDSFPSLDESELKAIDLQVAQKLSEDIALPTAGSKPKTTVTMTETATSSDSICSASKPTSMKSSKEKVSSSRTNLAEKLPSGAGKENATQEIDLLPKSSIATGFFSSTLLTKDTNPYHRHHSMDIESSIPPKTAVCETKHSPDNVVDESVEQHNVVAAVNNAVNTSTRHPVVVETLVTGSLSKQQQKSTQPRLQSAAMLEDGARYHEATDSTTYSQRRQTPPTPLLQEPLTPNNFGSEGSVSCRGTWQESISKAPHSPSIVLRTDSRHDQSKLSTFSGTSSPSDSTVNFENSFGFVEPNNKETIQQQPSNILKSPPVGSSTSVPCNSQSPSRLVSNATKPPSEIPTSENLENAFGFGSSSDQVEPSSLEMTTKIDTDERQAEVDPELYAPQPLLQSMEKPMVHLFSKLNRPTDQRRRLSVAQVFDTPVNFMWKSKFNSFNHLQSEIANMLAYSDDNVVVSAPTGAGKTVVFEMAMARFFSCDLQTISNVRNADRRQRTIQQQVSKSRKIVYFSPSKALCEERFTDWSKMFSAMKLGIEVAMVTGDGDPTESFRDLASAHVILATPEKFDSLTRRWTENFFLFATVKLILIDEVHLLADDSRGSCLEAIVCRMKTIQQAAQHVQVTDDEIAVSSYSCTSPEAIHSSMRIVAVSATLPNIAEIAEFLDANEAHTFDESYRPVPLTTHVIGQGYVGDKSNSQFRFWSSLDRNVPEIIHKFSNKRPSIVFCHSKSDTEKVADLLATAHGIGCSGGAVYSEIAGQTRLQKLQRVLLHGIAYHHAGLDLEDRRLVEKSFSSGKIRVLCATSTLAMGVNLPAHLVVIKGTKAWRGGASGYQDLDQASLLQMIGRAGRPGFDTSGTAVIMTDNKSKRMFEKLASSGLEPAKSQLVPKLDEIINAEISQRVITSTETALNWIKGTLFFVQVQNDPLNYGIQMVSPHSIDNYLLRLCGDSIRRLRAIGALIPAQGQELVPLGASHIMSQSLAEYQAMELIVQLAFDATQSQILATLSQIKGMHRPVRRSEKKFLNEVHKMIKHKLNGPPSKVRVKEPWEKAFVLLQASVGQNHPDDYTLRQEMCSMVDYSSRMLSAMEDYSIRGSRHGQVAVESLKLRRAFTQDLWCGSSGVLRQLKGIGQTTTTSLKFNGINTFEDVLAASDENIEKAAKRGEPFGNNLKMAVTKIMQSTLKISAHIENVPGTRNPCNLICRLETRKGIPGIDSAKDSNAQAAVTYTVIAHTDRPGGCIIYQKNISRPVTYKVKSPPKFGSITIHLIASLVGLDEKVELKGNDEIAASSFSSSQAAGGKKPNSLKRGARDLNRKADRRLNGRFRGEAKAAEDRQLLRKLPQKRAISSYFAEMSSKRGDNTCADNNKHTATKSNVTPSPKPSPKDLQVIARTEAASQQLSTQTVTVGAQHGPSLTVENTALPFERRRLTASMIGCNINQGSMTSETPTSAHHIPGTFDRLTQESQWMNQSAFSTRPREYSQEKTGMLPTQKKSWQQAKLHQKRSQKRAFVRKRDNPFSRYKHDPNDAESLLDELSCKNLDRSPQDSVIPQESLQTLATAYNTGHKHNIIERTIVGRARRRAPFMGQRRGIRRFSSSQEVLAQKAQEQNSYFAQTASRYTMTPSPAPNNNWSSQPSGICGLADGSTSQQAPVITHPHQVMMQSPHKHYWSSGNEESNQLHAADLHSSTYDQLDHLIPGDAYFAENVSPLLGGNGMAYGHADSMIVAGPSIPNTRTFCEFSSYNARPGQLYETYQRPGGAVFDNQNEEALGRRPRNCGMNNTEAWRDYEEMHNSCLPVNDKLGQATSDRLGYDNEEKDYEAAFVP